MAKYLKGNEVWLQKQELGQAYEIYLRHFCFDCEAHPSAMCWYPIQS